MDYSQIRKATADVVDLVAALPVYEVGRNAERIKSAVQTLQWALLAHCALVALRDYFQDEVAPHGESWWRDLVGLVGMERPAPTKEECDGKETYPPAPPDNAGL